MFIYYDLSENNDPRQIFESELTKLAEQHIIAKAPLDLFTKLNQTSETILNTDFNKLCIIFIANN